MASYELLLKPSVEKDLRFLPKRAIERVWTRIESLRDNPLPRQSVKLSGTQRMYRVRVGVYRITYEVDEKAQRVVVHYVRHRREVYRTR